MSPLLIFITLSVFSICAVLFSFWKGATAERIAALVVVANMALGLALRETSPDLAGTVRFASDGLSAVILLVVTVRYGAPWMGGVMLFYAAQFSLHSFYLVTDRANTDYLHALINNINFAGVSWCLIIGTAVTARKRWRRMKDLQAPPS
jgi:hypothetical protein